MHRLTVPIYCLALLTTWCRPAAAVEDRAAAEAPASLPASAQALMESPFGLKLKGECKFQIEGWPNCIPRNDTGGGPAGVERRRRAEPRPDRTDRSESKPVSSPRSQGEAGQALPPPPLPRPDRPWGSSAKVRTYERMPMLVGSSLRLTGSRWPAQQFGAQEDEPGRLNVIAVTATVPLGDGLAMRRAGEVPLARERKWWPFRPAERPARHFTIEEARAIPPAAIGHAVRTMLAVLPSATGVASRRALVFFHGFNSPCDYAQYRAAQLAYDTSFKGALATFCWPTDAGSTAFDLRKYPHDLASASRSVSAARLFLRLLIEESELERVELVGFSMGARIAIQAAKEIIVERQDPKRKLEGIYLAAADEDQRAFRDDHLKVFARQDIRVVIYASEFDGWMSLSESLHKAPRVGSGGRGLLCVPGVEAVEAGRRDAPSRGHDLFAVPEVLDHLKGVLAGSRQMAALALKPTPCQTAGNTR